MANYPQICADLKKIKHNVDTLCALCAEYGVSVAAVTKVVCADERIVRVLEHSAATMLADARTENLAKLNTKKPKLLLRAPSPEEAEETVELAEISLVSEIETIRALGSAARAAGKVHKIILMIDLGDLREGLLFLNREQIYAAARTEVQRGKDIPGFIMGTAVIPFGTPTARSRIAGVTSDDFDLREAAERDIDESLDLVAIAVRR